jgi:hypothetical protein
MILPSNDFEHNFTGYNIDNMSHVPAPKPSLNGGLYTGESFKPNAEYRNFPVKPESLYMISNLSSANPPPGAQSQFPDNFRPGNNMPHVTDIMPLKKYSEQHSIICTKR